MGNIRNTNFEIKPFNEEHKNDNNSVKLPQDAAHILVKYSNLSAFLTKYIKISLASNIIIKIENMVKIMFNFSFQLWNYRSV